VRNAVPVRHRSIECRCVPRHDAIRNPAAPLEIAVAALPPCIAEKHASGGERAAPAEVNALDANGW